MIKQFLKKDAQQDNFEMRLNLEVCSLDALNSLLVTWREGRLHVLKPLAVLRHGRTALEMGEGRASSEWRGTCLLEFLPGVCALKMLRNG